MPVPPLFEFELALAWRYYVRVFFWPTRAEMTDAADARDDFRGAPLDAVTCPEVRGRRVADVHFCRPGYTEPILVHELFHVMNDYHSRVHGRFRSPASEEEHVARVIERAFNAARSHIREELRLQDR